MSTQAQPNNDGVPPIEPPTSTPEPQDEVNPVIKALYDAATEDLPEDELVQEARQRHTSLKYFGDQEGDLDLPKEEETPPVEENIGDSEEVPDSSKEKVKTGVQRLKKKDGEEKVQDLPNFDLPEKQIATENQKTEDETDSFFEEDLTEEEQERLELARFASQHFDEFKGLDKKYKDFFIKHREYVEKLQDDSSFEDFDQNSPQYQEFLKKNRPKLSLKEVKKIERAMIREEVRKDLEQGDSAKEISELKQKLKSMEETPKIAEQQKAFETALTQNLPEDISKVVSEKGIEAVQEQFPLEAEVIQNTLNYARQMSETFLRVARGVESYNPNSAIHKQINDFIAEQGNAFFHQGGEARFRDGKQFLPRSKFSEAARAGQQDKYWTFSEQDVLDILAAHSGNHIKSQIKSQYDLIQKAGYLRQTSEGQQSSNQASNEMVQESSSPTVRPSPTKPSNRQQKPPQNALMKTLGY